MKPSDRHLIRGGTWIVVTVVLTFLQWVGTDHCKKFIAAAIILAVAHTSIAALHLSREPKP